MASQMPLPGKHFGNVTASASRRPFSFLTTLEEQIADALLIPFEGEVADVLLLPSKPAEGRPNPKVFVVAARIDLDLYERITRVTLQLADICFGKKLNFDIISPSARPLIPVEALSVRG